MALRARARKKHLLSAFKLQEAGVDFSPNGQQKLKFLELCWERLVEGNGRGFFDLWMTIMLGNNDDPPNQPLYGSCSDSMRCNAVRPRMLGCIFVAFLARNISVSPPRLPKDNIGITRHSGVLQIGSCRVRSQENDSSKLRP